MVVINAKGGDYWHYGVHGSSKLMLPLVHYGIWHIWELMSNICSQADSLISFLYNGCNCLS